MPAPEATYDVLGIGNAIVDVLGRVDDGFLTAQGLVKGSMALIDGARAETLYGAMSGGVESSGGSAANTVAGVASFGGRSAFVGKVADDPLGEVFARDLRSVGVAYDAPPASGGEPTARCMVFVTPDAQRTMCTFLGVSRELARADLDPDLVARSRVTFMEGYLWDPPAAKDAFVRAAEVAHAHGREVALSLSDPFCVERHRASFLDLIDHHIDLVIANELEIKSLFETDSFDEAAQRVASLSRLAVLTRSERGAVVVSGAERVVVPAVPVDRVVDTTGAGDLFAAGFLYGHTHGYGLERAARLGARAAAEVISHMGARPKIELAALRDA
ncbi:MAG: adenosine kinase [Myxococcales bacterium]|nr:adenosine kinase [Myxococcales bacterium]